MSSSRKCDGEKAPEHCAIHEGFAIRDGIQKLPVARIRIGHEPNYSIAPLVSAQVPVITLAARPEPAPALEAHLRGRTPPPPSPPHARSVRSRHSAGWW